MSGGGADWVLGGEAGEGAGVGRHGCCVVILDFREGRKEGYTTLLWQIQSAKRRFSFASALWYGRLWCSASLVRAREMECNVVTLFSQLFAACNTDNQSA